MDVLNNFADTDTLFDPGEPASYRPGGRTAPDPALVEKAAELLDKAQRPVIMAGTAVWWCDAAEPLRKLAERISGSCLSQRCRTWLSAANTSIVLSVPHVAKHWKVPIPSWQSAHAWTSASITANRR